MLEGKIQVAKYLEVEEDTIPSAPCFSLSDDNSGHS